MANILVTGAGSVMGQSTFRALDLHQFRSRPKVHFANSEPIAAGREFKPQRMDLVATPVLPLANDTDYLPTLEAYVRQHEIDIVYAGTQHELLKIASLRDRTGNAATLSTAAAELCTDKSLTNKILRSRSLKTPDDQLFAEWLEKPLVGGDVIIKPRSSSASRNIFRIAGGHFNRQAIENATASIGSNHVSDFVVQSMLRGEEFTCGCYVDRYSKATSVIILRRTLTADGATLFGEVVRHEAIESYVKGCASALAPHGFEFGHINVQLILTLEGPIAFEINGRLSSTERPKAYLGFNSTAAYYENIVEKRPYQFGDVQPTGRFIRYYDEIYF